MYFLFPIYFPTPTPIQCGATFTQVEFGFCFFAPWMKIPDALLKGINFPPTPSTVPRKLKHTHTFFEARFIVWLAKSKQSGFLLDTFYQVKIRRKGTNIQRSQRITGSGRDSRDLDFLVELEASCRSGYLFIHIHILASLNFLHTDRNPRRSWA